MIIGAPPDSAVRVLVVGNAPSGPTSRGGMASVVALMVERADRDPTVDLALAVTHRDIGRLARVGVWLRGTAEVLRAVRRRRVDVVHVHLSHRGSVVRKAVAMAAARRAGVPVVLHAHSYDFAGWFDGLSRRGQRWTRRALAADTVVVLAASQLPIYRDRLGVAADDVAIVPNPVAAFPPAPRPVADRLRVAFLGRYGERKGIDDVVAAVARLPATDRARLRVVTAGDGEVDRVRADVVALGLADVVEVRGWIGPTERDALLDASDVFVLPSHDEALPMALLEAIGHGLVPVVSPVGAMPEVVRHGENGLLVPAGDPDALAAALHSLLHDAPLRTRLAAAAAATGAGRGVEAWWDGLSVVWRDLARGRPVPAATVPATPARPAPR